MAAGEVCGAGLLGVARRMERSGRLGEAAAALDRGVPEALRSGPLRAVLAGRWLGHSLHPLLTDFPLGFWASASVLDLVGGDTGRVASRRLVGLGVLAALPTMATGLSDWTRVGRGPKRVGVVHAAVNTTATLLYAASYVARRRDAATGVVLGLLGGVAATAGGFFGGHLTLTAAVTESNALIPHGRDTAGGGHR